jgi:hypothetical protein
VPQAEVIDAHLYAHIIEGHASFSNDRVGGGENIIKCWNIDIITEVEYCQVSVHECCFNNTELNS